MTVGSFDLTVGLWVVDGGVIEFNTQISTPGFYLVGCEVGAVVSDDVVWDTITVHNIGYEVYHRAGLSRFDRFSLYPLSEFVHHNQQIFFLMASPFKGSNHVESPDRKSQSDGDCL